MRFMFMSQHSSVIITTKLGDGLSTTWTGIFLFAITSRQALRHTQPPIQLVPRAIFTSDKATGA